MDHQELASVDDPFPYARRRSATGPGRRRSNGAAKGRLEFFGRTGGLLLPLLRCTKDISLIKYTEPDIKLASRGTHPSHAKLHLGEVNEYLR